MFCLSVGKGKKIRIERQALMPRCLSPLATAAGMCSSSKKQIWSGTEFVPNFRGMSS